MGRRKSKVKKPVTIKKVWRRVASSSAPPPSPPWIELPRDVTANILHRLGVVDILENAQKVCTTWRRVCQDPSMWRVIEIKIDCDLYDWYDLNLVCRHAVDRSQGQLVDISLDNFESGCDDELLHYICGRSSQLKRLTLVSCYAITSKGLSEAVQKTPQLEELHLVLMPSLFAREIETIGISCPMLKSFSFNDSGCTFPLPENPNAEDLLIEGPIRNAFALAVAKNMPNLRHLGLFANGITNVGLEAILDVCPNLESLDLRRCHGLDLGGDLGKRLSRQMKSLKRPSDPIDDYEWDSGESYMDNYIDSDYDSDVYSIGDYDDYTNPFSSEYLSDTDAMFFDFANAMGFGYDGDL